MRSNAITFADLRGFLESLGFEPLAQKKGFVFQHAATDTRLLFRHYEPREQVQPADLAVTRKMLDERGILSADRFEHRMAKAPA
jgi:hypothetical protein